MLLPPYHRAGANLSGAVATPAGAATAAEAAAATAAAAVALQASGGFPHLELGSWHCLAAPASDSVIWTTTLSGRNWNFKVDARGIRPLAPSILRMPS